MRRRRAVQRDDIHVPAIVVTYLGRTAAVSMLIGGFLVWRVIETSAGSKTAADAAVIGLVMAFLGFGTGCIAALSAILASTRTTSATEPTGTRADPVNVTLPDEPVQVTPVPADGGAGELRLIGLFAAATVLALIAYHFIAPHLT